jgi:chromosome segregation ATPase
MKKELKQLRDIIEEFQDIENPYSEKLEKCITLIDTIEDDMQELVDEVDTLKGELDDANTEISNLQDAEPDYGNSVDLGLDTIHYKLESGNLKVSQQLESAFNLIKL